MQAVGARTGTEAREPYDRLPAEFQQAQMKQQVKLTLAIDAKL